jgi:hypothetical protein
MPRKTLTIIALTGGGLLIPGLVLFLVIDSQSSSVPNAPVSVVEPPVFRVAE